MNEKISIKIQSYIKFSCEFLLSMPEYFTFYFEIRKQIAIWAIYKKFHASGGWIDEKLSYNFSSYRFIYFFSYQFFFWAFSISSSENTFGIGKAENRGKDRMQE